ncbi:MULTISPECIES: hypothetical protein [unclassified Ekhidna]|jgi:hypothetical protein|uniref:hypothetical protein n=1 Tax=unclassified Ekhidna TaxID=2632188 RepID=UPI0032DE3A42
MRSLSKIALFVAVSFLMLHTFMPHHHLDQISEEQHFTEHSEADSLIDFIRLAFHLNPGENHLEEFEQNTGVILHFPVADFHKIEVPNQVVDIVTPSFVEAQDVAIEHQFTSLSLSFRGPPQLV